VVDGHQVAEVFGQALGFDGVVLRHVVLLWSGVGG
jgi:hypothetical protein